MRILIATDAWFPQINGVVRTLATVVRELESLGHEVEVVGPDRFPTVPMPSYPEIRVAIAPGRRLARLLDQIRPDAVHIPVEGPIGLAARRHCLKRGWPFTTSYHTRAGLYFQEKFGVPHDLVLALQRWFHNAGSGFMVQTDSLERELGGKGFTNIRRWSRGVDTELFRPRDTDGLLALPRPVFTYVGRVSAEKNLGDFLALDLPGTKLVVGEGPQLAEYRERYPSVVFAGWKQGEELSRYYSASDVFVMPSRFETFGLVLLEALACGVPVAAYPVHGPIDVIGPAPVGVLDHDLRHAALRALAIPRTLCREFALRFSWRRSTEQFLANLMPIERRPARLAGWRIIRFTDVPGSWIRTRLPDASGRVQCCRPDTEPSPGDHPDAGDLDSGTVRAPRRCASPRLCTPASSRASSQRRGSTYRPLSLCCAHLLRGSKPDLVTSR
jgi:glycosyltransferase involved in cell wall biosynthesis